MSVLETLQTESGLTLLGGVLGTLWTAFKASDFYVQLRGRRYSRAVQAIEAAVEKTYRTYVQAIKSAREDGKLTPEERREARRLAREAAIEFGRTQGVDVLRELGHEYIDLWITRLVNESKN